MKKLTKEQFEKARHFMKTQAQDIDLALFEYFFEDKPLNEVVVILSKYQNDDGGFGKLDYDFEYPYSCLKHTESACRYIFELNDISSDNSLIKKAILYIVANYNHKTGEWNNQLVPEVNDYPHAFWWEYEAKQPFKPKSRIEMIEKYNANVNAALAGLIVKYNDLVSSELLQKIQSVPIEKIRKSGDFSQYDMMSYTYFLNQITDENLRNELFGILMGNGKLLSILDDGFGVENALKICNYFSLSNHPFFEIYKDDINKYMDFIIESQQPDGSWIPDWSWGEPGVWARVQKRLQGEITYKFLQALKKYNRI